MVRTIVIGQKQERPVKRQTLGQKLYNRAKWFGKKVYDVSSKAAMLAVPVVAGAALAKYNKNVKPNANPVLALTGPNPVLALPGPTKYQQSVNHPDANLFPSVPRGTNMFQLD